MGERRHTRPYADASFGDDVTFEATSTRITNKVQQMVYVPIKALTNKYSQRRH